MKKYLTLILFLGFILSSSAQDKQKNEYCQASISTYLTTSGAQLDAEGKIPFKLNNKKYVIDKHGKNIEFSSVADFINFMADYNWEFEAFFPAYAGDSRINILFKRVIKPKLQEADSNIKSKTGG